MGIARLRLGGIPAPAAPRWLKRVRREVGYEESRSSWWRSGDRGAEGRERWRRSWRAASEVRAVEAQKVASDDGMQRRARAGEEAGEVTAAD